MKSDLIKSFSAADAIRLIAHESFHGNENAAIKDFVALNEVTIAGDCSQSFAWVKDSRVKDFPKGSTLGLLILTAAAYEQLKNEKCNFLVVKEPRIAFFELLNHQLKSIYKEKNLVENTALIDASAVIGSNTYIGHHVVIESGVVIGNNCVIQHHTVIMRNTQIGNDVKIGCHNTIGNSGFGFEKGSDGNYFRLPHLGNVVIGNDVTVHNNCCIDRGALGSTILGNNVNLDNMVHVAHNVKIGNHTMLTASVMIAGSVTIGKNCWLAPCATLMNGITIGDNVTIGLGAVLVKDVQAGTTVTGNPATNMDEVKQWNAIRKRLLAADKPNLIN